MRVFGGSLMTCYSDRELSYLGASLYLVLFFYHHWRFGVQSWKEVAQIWIVAIIITSIFFVPRSCKVMSGAWRPPPMRATGR